MQKKAGDLATSLRFFLNPKAGFLAKAFMLLTVVYVIMPVDFVPDVIVIVGWIDDLIALLAAGTGLLLAFRRFQREQGAALQTPQESYITPGVVETQGTEVR